jgi:predicted nucleic acid-binding protein
MDVMVGADAELVEPTRYFLEGFSVIALDDGIARQAVELRRTHRVKLPDAVIWATARTTKRLFITRDTRDFPADDPGLRKPYTL